jgi:hypothetical protein
MKGALHIVPPAISPADIGRVPTGHLTRSAALEVVRSGRCKTEASPSIALCINERIAGYPAKTAESLHVSRAFLPEDLARALAADPQLVGLAVEAFYMRDPIGLKVCPACYCLPR